MQEKTIAYVSTSPSDYSNRVAHGIVRYISQQSHLKLQVMGKQGFIPLWDPSGFVGDGVIGMFSSEEHADEYRNKGIPVVNVSASTSDVHPWVSIDNRLVGELAAEYFVVRGYEHFAFLNTTNNALYSVQRREGFRATMQKAGRYVHELILSSPITQTPVDWYMGIDEVADKLKLLPKPLALFCGLDIVGRLASQACEREGIGVPEDVAILGVDNEELICNACRVPLSSMEQGEDRVGFMAAQLLDRLLQGREVAQEIVIPPVGIVERRSTDAAAVADEPIACALAYMRENLAEPIAMLSVAKVSGMSRSLFERRFKNAVGRTPASELQRMRVERARQLLLATRLSIDKIAVECGFRRRERLHEAFKRVTGYTPAAYRKNYGG